MQPHHHPYSSGIGTLLHGYGSFFKTDVAPNALYTRQGVPNILKRSSLKSATSLTPSLLDKVFIVSEKLLGRAHMFFCGKNQN